MIHDSIAANPGIEPDDFEYARVAQAGAWTRFVSFGGAD